MQCNDLPFFSFLFTTLVAHFFIHSSFLSYAQTYYCSQAKEAALSSLVCRSRLEIMSLTSRQVCMDNMDSASDQQHQWLQATVHEDTLMDSFSSPSGLDMLEPSQILLSERRLRPPQDLALKCPRCDSTHTKFCYYNNYSLSQPRFFCKTCRRYWTKGGTLRNIPVGGGFRKNRKSMSSNKKLSSNEQLSVSSINNQNTGLNMMMMSMPNANPSDLQLSFPLLQLPNMLTSSGNYTESMLFNKSIPMHDNNDSSNDGLIIRPTDHHKQHVVAMNHMTSRTNTYGSYLSSQFVEGGGYDDMQNVHYANNDYIGLSNYIDNNNNNNNYSNSAAQSQLVEYSGLHEYQPNNIQIMHHEVKPSTNMLALEWQQKVAGYPDANSKSKQDSSFSYDMLRSWRGMSSSTAGNTYHHPPATTHN